MDLRRILAYATGTVDEETLLRNECLAAENRILRAQIKGRLRLSDTDLAQRLGRKALEELSTIVQPDTLLRWYRRLIARKFDSSKVPRSPGRPRTDAEIEELVLRLARSNRTWGYDRISGALAGLGISLSDQTVGNILERNGLKPVSHRRMGDSPSSRRRRIPSPQLLQVDLRVLEVRILMDATADHGDRVSLQRIHLDVAAECVELVLA